MAEYLFGRAVEVTGFSRTQVERARVRGLVPEMVRCGPYWLLPVAAVDRSDADATACMFVTGRDVHEQTIWGTARHHTLLETLTEPRNRLGNRRFRRVLR